MGYRQDNAAELCFFCDLNSESICSRCEVPLCKQHKDELCQECTKERTYGIVPLEQALSKKKETAITTIKEVLPALGIFHLFLSAMIVIFGRSENMWFDLVGVNGLLLAIESLMGIGFAASVGSQLIPIKNKLKQAESKFIDDKPQRALPPPKEESD